MKVKLRLWGSNPEADKELSEKLQQLASKADIELEIDMVDVLTNISRAQAAGIVVTPSIDVLEPTDELRFIAISKNPATVIQRVLEG